MTITLRELARKLDCPFEGDGAVEINGVAGLEQAGPGELVFWPKRSSSPPGTDQGVGRRRSA